MKLKYIFFILIEGIAGILLKFKLIAIPCFFKTLFHIPCPACGMTRAFYEIFRFNFIGAFRYNVLTIPLLLYLVTLNFLIIVDTVKNSNYFHILIKKTIDKYYIIISLFIISFIINVFRGV